MSRPYTGESITLEMWNSLDSEFMTKPNGGWRSTHGGVCVCGQASVLWSADDCIRECLANGRELLRRDK
jgi:hypothetical protein